MENTEVHAVRGFRVAFGKHMRAVRTRRGLTQAQAGTRAGVDRTTVGAMERADRAVGVEMLHRYAKAYGVPTHALLPPGPRPAHVRVGWVDLAARGVELRLVGDAGGDQITVLLDGAGPDRMLLPATADMVAVVEAMWGVDIGRPMRTA
jgi:transcriptional regulator with XRE-family HTH domain